MFDNPIVKVLGQQVISLWVVWLSGEVEFFIMWCRKCRVNGKILCCVVVDLVSTISSLIKRDGV